MVTKVTTKVEKGKPAARLATVVVAPMQPVVKEVQAKSEMELEVKPDEKPTPKDIKPQPPEKPKPLTLTSIKQEVDGLRTILEDHARLINDLFELTARKRKAVSNGKVEILDKVTGEVFRSKNSTYQTLLKKGELKELVDKGIFGSDPAKNNFGWYSLLRAWPDKFEVIKKNDDKVKESDTDKDKGKDTDK